MSVFLFVMVGRFFQSGVAAFFNTTMLELVSVILISYTCWNAAPGLFLEFVFVCVFFVVEIMTHPWVAWINFRYNSHEP